jgi:hypothetical protein
VGWVPGAHLALLSSTITNKDVNFLFFFLVLNFVMHYLSPMQETNKTISQTQFYPTYVCKNIDSVCKNIDSKWNHFVWTCELITSKGSIRLVFKTGLAHVIKAKSSFFNDKPKPPTLEDVLYSLIADSRAAELSFGDWCDEYGYEEDSISAFYIYRECCETAKKLKTIYSRNEIEEIKEFLKDY